MINLSIVINEGMDQRVSIKVNSFDCVKTHREKECLRFIEETIETLKHRYAFLNLNQSNDQ